VVQVDTYRQMAEQCRAHAQLARTAELRALNLELAQYWDDVARQQEEAAKPRKEWAAK
jgi:hypothetical protein